VDKDEPDSMMNEFMIVFVLDILVPKGMAAVSYGIICHHRIQVFNGTWKNV
jgi:hypothetical protein